MRRSFFFSLIALLLGILMQSALSEVTALKVDLALAALLFAAFFLQFHELLFLAVFSALLLNWQPSLGIELLAFMGVPLVFSFLGRLFPYHPAAGVMLAVASGIFLFYMVTDASLVFQEPALLAEDLFLAASFAAALLLAASLLHIQPEPRLSRFAL